MTPISSARNLEPTTASNSETMRSKSDGFDKDDMHPSADENKTPIKSSSDKRQGKRKIHAGMFIRISSQKLSSRKADPLRQCWSKGVSQGVSSEQVTGKEKKT